MSYTIAHRRNFNEPQQAWVDGRIFHCLKDANLLRVVSGDLVIDIQTGKIVVDTDWLWDWEKQDPKSYAQQAIEWQARQP